MWRVWRYNYLILILVLAGTLFLASGCISKPGQTSTGPISTPDSVTLTYYTEQFPPYNYQENGTLKGVAVDLLGEITGKMGRRVTPDQVQLVPWTEGYQAALTRNNIVLFSTYRLPERAQSFKWAGPIFTERHVLFATRDQAVAINDSGDLKGYRIGVVTDDAGIQQLLNLGVDRNQLVYDTNVSVLIGKLSRGEIDLWCYPEIVGRSIARQVTGNYYSFNVVFKLQNTESYYAFSKDVPDSTVKSFQQALDALKQEKDAAGVSTYDRILRRYIPSIGIAHLNFLTEEWAPFNYQEGGKPAGISVEILEAIFRNMAVDRTRADVRIVPLADGFQQAKGNTSTVLFSIVRTPEREPLYKWAGPITKSSFVIFAPKSRNITIASPGDLNRFRIGAVKTSIENDLLISQGVNKSHIIPGLAPDELLKMLEGGQIDLLATGDLTGRYEMKKAGVNPDAYEIVYTLSENDFYYIFSRDVSDMLVSSFQQAFQTVKYQRDAQGISEYERIIYRNLGVGCTRQAFTDEAVMALVDTTAAAIEKNASDTFRHINAGDAPYRDPKNPALYVFVYDMNLTIVAHADNILMVGVNYRGKTDASGKPFRDEILAGALKNGTGWVDYVYLNPVQTNLYYKTAYYRLTRGSDGNSYIVGSGNYKRCG
jgi:polar amino acid transport system substrate-binding protein